MKWLRRLFLSALLLVLVTAVALGSYAWLSLPKTQGELSLAGAKAPIRIERDAHGIPSIVAGSVHDAVFGLGVVHAQDRLWQMETHRRIGAGRMAELFGEPALETDRFLRALAVRRAATAQWGKLPDESKALIQAYTAGVNAVIQSGLRALPPEFAILRTQPEPWEPVDSLSWALMMAWEIGRAHV